MNNHIQLEIENHKTTYNFITNQYFMSSTREDVLRIIESCKKIAFFNGNGKYNCSYTLLIKGTFGRIGIDLLGQLNHKK